MHNPDDKFEAYLKRFQPLIPTLAAIEHTRVARRLPRLAVWIAAVAVMTIVGVLLRLQRPQIAVPVVTNLESSDMCLPTGPLTQQNTNEWLTRAPSFKTAVDQLGFRPRNQLDSAGQAERSRSTQRGEDQIMKLFSKSISTLLVTVSFAVAGWSQQSVPLGQNAALQYWSAMSVIRDAGISEQQARAQCNTDGSAAYDDSKYRDSLEKNRLALEVMARGPLSRTAIGDWIGDPITNLEPPTCRWST